MKKVLYITNIEVPYKIRFFNELAKISDLTVVFERNLSSNRDENWAKSEEIHFKKIVLDGHKIGNENAFSFSLLKIINGFYDEIIISCINSPVQLMAIQYMKLRGIRYTFSFDGEIFLDKPGIKTCAKKFFVKGADKYLTAGEKSAQKLKDLVKTKEVYPYFFSSYTNDELRNNSLTTACREKFVLVVGQYFDYKGLDIAVRLAKKTKIKYKFIGTGKRTDLFIENEKITECSNIEVIPFLQKEDLNKEFQKAAVMFLPSRQECWGLVVNEAASFGTPIVSTTGSGAALEFISDYEKQYLFSPTDEVGISSAISYLLDNNDEKYSDYLKEKSRHYSIEEMVIAHANALGL